MVTESQLDTLRDLKKFSEKFLYVKDKNSGQKVLFTFNRAQEFVHQRLEAQLKERGIVRAAILKGRQLGISTYISGRYFKKIITTRGKKAFILTHEEKATKNLFDMTNRFYSSLEPGLCPRADTSTAKELHFKTFDSGYSIGTAGSKGTGRSQTIHLFHGSEIAFWPDASSHARGVLQAVPSSEDTEIILESTANGMGDYFHSLWLSAMAGKSEFQAIFIPWYWDDGYRRRTLGFKLDDDEANLLSIYKNDGLTIDHLDWRRLKINEYSNDPDAGLDLFKSEYPFNADEAFRNPINNVFINSNYVLIARKNDVDSDAALIIGVDPAIGNNDRTAIIRRKGRLAYQMEWVRNHNTMEIAGKLNRIIEQEKPAKVYIDCIGIGAGVVDRLKEMGKDCVEGVNVARSANLKDKFKNLRAELWSNMRDWLTQELPVQIPNSDELHGELCSLGYKYNSNGQLIIESKDELRKRGFPSPDLADALMLTFYAGQYAGESVYEVKVIPKHHRNQFI